MTDPAARRRRETLVRAALLIVLPALAYLPTLGGDFLGDDRQITLNPHLLAADGWRSALTESFHYPLDAERNEYRPLTTLSLWSQVRMTGLEAAPLHLFNLVLHLAVVVVFYGLLRRVPVRCSALAGAALFGIHPLFSEAVSLIVGRADLLATLLGLLAWRLHLARAGTGGRERILRTGGAVACVVLATFAKESGIAVLGALLVSDLVLDRSCGSPRSRLTALLRLHAPLWLAPPIVVVIRIALRGAIWYRDVYLPIDNPLVDASLPVRWATALWVVVKGWGLFLWPGPLSTDYSYNQIPPIRTPTDPRLLLTVLVGVALAWLLRRTWAAGWRAPTWGSAVFFCLALPTSNLVLVIGTILGERLLYLPGLMLAAVAGFLAGRLLDQRLVSRRLALSLLVVVTAALWVRTFSRSFDWTSREALSRRQQVVAPDSVRTWKHLALQHYEAGRTAAALAALDRALAITPDWAEIWMLRSQAQARAGRLDEAVDSARQILARGNPGPDLHLYLAELLHAAGRREEEIEILRRGLERFPSHEELRHRYDSTGAEMR